MTEPDPGAPSRGGAHRAPATPAAVARNLAGPIVAVVAVAVAVVLLVILNGRPAHKGSPTVAAPPSTFRSATSSATQSARPTAHATRSTQQPTTTTSPPPVTTALRAPVTVLNNSPYAGLATKVAAQVREGGWPVAQVGNFTGRVAAPTIYFAPGQEAAARAFATRFPRVERVLPRFAGLPGHGLTLVVTRQWDP